MRYLHVHITCDINVAATQSHQTVWGKRRGRVFSKSRWRVSWPSVLPSLFFNLAYLHFSPKARFDLFPSNTSQIQSPELLPELILLQNIESIPRTMCLNFYYPKYVQGAYLPKWSYFSSFFSYLILLLISVKEEYWALYFHMYVCLSEKELCKTFFSSMNIVQGRQVGNQGISDLLERGVRGFGYAHIL